ncbi:ComF family protein [Ruminococcus sp.]|uniref:ComF family protein n=1 Tax=Ruminococcus sp. TaxID=41978 RepID=UPI0025EE4311|nr:ComF family protein [Ruminococcus sp.]
MRFETKRKILHLFFPTRCPVCGDIIGAMDKFCKSCEGKLSIYDGTFSIEGAKSFTAAFEYDDSVKPAIFLMKNGIGGNADFALGSILAERLKSEGVSDKIDIIVPAPLHKKDLLRRGFNQSLLIAKEISRSLNIPVEEKAVFKSRRTRAQKELDHLKRSLNLKNAFSADSEKIKGKRVLIVDDICTTGSTLRELTAVVKENGAVSVHCACCCKTAKKNVSG